LLGFGSSDKPSDANYSIELFVQLLEDFVLTMEPEKDWIIAGNSIGGLCSLGLADKLHDQIKGVVLFNTSGGMSSFRYDQIPFFLRPILWFVQKFLLGNPKWGGNFFENFKTRENVESILMTQGVYGNTTNVDEELLDILLGPADDEGARDVFLKVFGGEPGPTPESFLARIECPVLGELGHLSVSRSIAYCSKQYKRHAINRALTDKILCIAFFALALWGESDPWTVIAMGKAFGKHAKANNYRLEALPGAGHCPHDECPELVSITF
jgi:pimeloyl-ACP methyl ester carboxylesterase